MIQSSAKGGGVGTEFNPLSEPMCDDAKDNCIETTKRDLDRLTAAQALSLAVVDDLLSATFEDVDTAIDAALARLGAFSGSDRAMSFGSAGRIPWTTRMNGARTASRR